MSRLYQVGNAAYPSVTTILSVLGKPGLMFWQRNMSLKFIEAKLKEMGEDDVSVQDTMADPQWLETLIQEAKAYPKSTTTHAATLGTKAHEAFEDLCCGKEIEIDQELKPLVQGFNDWKAQEPDLHIIEVEKVLHSKTHGYAGTVDAIGMRFTGDSSEIVILDWKTSNALYPDYALQVSAYAKAYEEMYDCPGSIKEAQVVRFDKYKPVFEAKRVFSIDESFERFLSCLHLYKSQKQKAYGEFLVSFWVPIGLREVCVHSWEGYIKSVQDLHFLLLLMVASVPSFRKTHSFVKDTLKQLESGAHLRAEGVDELVSIIQHFYSALLDIALKFASRNVLPGQEVVVTKEDIEYALKFVDLEELGQSFKL